MDQTLTIYYDGHCPLCSREIAYFRKRVGGATDVVFLDIASPDFDARSHNIDTVRLHRVMHVKVGDEVRTGLEALRAIWRRVPGFGWLARLSGLPGLYTAFDLGYRLFARVRPYLPRRKSRCSEGTCSR